MKLRCPYCRTVFEKLASPVCPGCNKTLRMAWETDLKTPAARAALRGSRRKVDPSPRRRGPAALPKPSIFMLPWLVVNYRSRLFMWSLVLAVVIVGRLLYTHKSDYPLMPDVRRANEARCSKELLALRTALEWFRAHCKRYPTEAEGLRALVRDPGVPGWRGHYINQLPPDPWGRPYLYALTNGSVRVWGNGADGTNGTPDDIASPEPDWRALLERVSVNELPRWAVSNAPAAAVTNRP